MKAIQIGVGSFGKTWRTGISNMGDVEVVGLVDMSADNITEAREHFGLPNDACFSDPFADWYEQIDADFIIDSTPHAHHYDNAMRAIRADMDVIVVKPFCDRLGDAKRLVEEADRLGRKIVVAQQIRFHPACLELKRLLASGIVGTVAYASVDAFFKRTGPVRDKWYQPYPLLMEAAIHHLDLIRWILDTDAESVVADSWDMPWNDRVWGRKSACCLFRMANGSRASFRGLPTDQPGDSYPGTWIIEGTDGILSMTDKRIFHDREPLWPPADKDAPGMDLAAYNAEVLRQSIEYFSRDKPISISGADNLRSLGMVFASIASSEQDRRVYLDELVASAGLEEKGEQ